MRLFFRLAAIFVIFASCSSNSPISISNSPSNNAGSQSGIHGVVGGAFMGIYPPPPECSIGADPMLTAGASPTLVGDRPSSWRRITSCEIITQNVVLNGPLSNPSGDCLVIDADNITIDGAGQTIDVGAGGYALQIKGHKNVTIRNVITSDGIWIQSNGEHLILENSRVGSIEMRNGGLNHEFIHNTLGGIYVGGTLANPPKGIKFIGNYGSSAGVDDFWFDGAAPLPYDQCPETNFVIEGNVFLNTNPSTYDNPNSFRISCAKGNVIRNNLFKGTGGGAGLYLRDAFDDSLFEWLNADHSGPFAGD